MDAAEIDYAREQVTDANERARVAHDPVLKSEWLRLAAIWEARVLGLQALPPQKAVRSNTAA